MVFQESLTDNGGVICLGGIIVQYFSKSILMLFAGKVVSTFGFGLGHSLGPVFVAELAPIKMRGLCLALLVSILENAKCQVFYVWY